MKDSEYFSVKIGDIFNHKGYIAKGIVEGEVILRCGAKYGDMFLLEYPDGGGISIDKMIEHLDATNFTNKEEIKLKLKKGKTYHTSTIEVSDPYYTKIAIKIAATKTARKIYADKIIRASGDELYVRI